MPAIWGRSRRPLTKALWDEFPSLEASRIKIYGWINPGGDYSTSRKSNIPESYAIVPNKLDMDQAVLRFERVPDTVQTDHVDWGFRLSVIYGSTTDTRPRKDGSANNCSNVTASTELIRLKRTDSSMSRTSRGA